MSLGQGDTVGRDQGNLYRMRHEDAAGAIPLRVALLGQPQTPSIDAVLETMGRELVLGRLDRVL
jgi:hypothetical protein